MEGYFRPRLITPAEELRTLEIEDTEFVPDDDIPPPSIATLVALSVAITHICPRCRAKNQIVGNDPYCTECNWDSLLIPGGHLRWAA
jgi:hypothetical protein